MTTSGILLVGALLGAGPLAPALDRIERAAESREITEAQRQYYRVASVRAPKRLPAALRTTELSPPRTRTCATPVLHEAFRSLPRFSPEDGAPVAALLAPPTDLAFTVETAAPFPVRVSYALASQEAMARQVMDAVETSFQKEVTEWGFTAPRLEPGSEFYRFFIMDTGPGIAGYTSPYQLDHDTPNTDAYTYIVINPALTGLDLVSTVAHEFNHACQAAMDITEVTSFLENTATYIEARVYPEAFPATARFFPYFQAAPWRPIEFMQPARSDGYEYGGALWVLFLEQLYGNQDPRWIRHVWEECEQSTDQNEPDYFDVLETQLAAHGGMAGAVRAFAQYRFFAGQDDDGQHLSGALHFTGAEVTRSATWATSQLPLVDRRPTELATRPQPNGCNYVVVDVDAPPKYPVKFAFTGDPMREWSVDVMRVALETTVHALPVAADGSGAGAVSVDARGANRLVLVVCQLGGQVYDPDRRRWTAADYRYSIVPDVPPATVTSVSPSEIARGTHGDVVTVRGSNFVDDASVVLGMSGTRARIELDRWVSATEIQARVWVAPSAGLGARDVSVTNPSATTGTGTGMISVVEPAPVDDAKGPGCACSALGRPPWAWVLLGLVAFRRRLRHALVGLAILSSPLGARAAELVGHVDSQLHPIHVYYTAEVGETVARDALRLADATWETQINTMGFPEPMMLDDAGQVVRGLRIDLDQDGQYNHAEPVADIPATPYTDCAVRVAIANTSPASYLHLIVNHETNHALEMSSDCLEAPFAFENTTVAVTTMLDPVNTLWTDHFLPVFQKSPWSGLDCTFFQDNAKFYFHYGASLFQVFLEESYGSNNGRLLSSLWEAARQDGTITMAGGGPDSTATNSPDLLQAIDTVLHAHQSSLREAFARFARWRYFVGENADQAHFQHGAEWGGSELTVDASYTVAELPAVNVPPIHSTNEFGSSYVEVDLFGMQPGQGLAYEFQGDGRVAWAVDALLVRADKSAEERSVAVDENTHGQLALDSLEGFTRVVFIASNLGGGAHDANNPRCNITRAYTYGIAVTETAVAAVLEGMEPGNVVAGERVFAWISGSGFTDGMTVTVSGQGVSVTQVKFVDASVLGVALDVAGDAATGGRDVTVTGPRGGTVTLASAFTVDAPGKGGARPPGCTCSVPSMGLAPGALLVLLLVRRRQFARM